MADDSSTWVESEAEAMSFVSARRHALAFALDATPAERLEWLEEAIEMAFASGALPRRPGAR